MPFMTVAFYLCTLKVASTVFSKTTTNEEHDDRGVSTIFFFTASKSSFELTNLILVMQSRVFHTCALNVNYALNLHNVRSFLDV